MYYCTIVLNSNNMDVAKNQPIIVTCKLGEFFINCMGDKNKSVPLDKIREKKKIWMKHRSVSNEFPSTETIGPENAPVSIDRVMGIAPNGQWVLKSDSVEKYQNNEKSRLLVNATSNIIMVDYHINKYLEAEKNNNFDLIGLIKKGYAHYYALLQSSIDKYNAAPGTVILMD